MCCLGAADLRRIVNSAAQEGAHFVGEIVLSKRLGEKGFTRFQQPALEHLRGEPRHVQDRLARPALLHVAAELPAIHPRHLDIGQDQMNRPCMLFEGGYSLSAVTGLERLVTGKGQHPRGQETHCLLVVHYQNRVAPWRALGLGRVSGGALQSHMVRGLSEGECMESIALSLGAASLYM